MVQVERLDDATEIVTDPRFGPPAPTEFDTSVYTNGSFLFWLWVAVVSTALVGRHRLPRRP